MYTYHISHYWCIFSLKLLKDCQIFNGTRIPKSMMGGSWKFNHEPVSSDPHILIRLAHLLHTDVTNFLPIATSSTWKTYACATIYLLQKSGWVSEMVCIVFFQKMSLQYTVVPLILISSWGARTILTINTINGPRWEAAEQRNQMDDNAG